MSKDYYSILDVEKTATQEEIKSKYRKLAMQYHPDRNPNDSDSEKKFKEVAEAYEILSDPNKRSHYDTFGHSQSGFHHGGDPFDFFHQMFGQRQTMEVKPMVLNVNITFMEAYKGCSKTLSYNKHNLCETCKGNGAKSFKKCSFCDGAGRLRHKQGFIHMDVSCNHCMGRGSLPNELCLDCNGTGYTSKQETLIFEIPEGSSNNTKIRMKGKGEVGPNGIIGDLILFLHVLPHKVFARFNDDLCITLPIGYADALLGCEVDAPHLNGELKITLPSNTRYGSILRVKDKGFKKNDSTYGDFLIKIIFDIADTNLSEDRIEFYRKLAELEKDYPSKAMQLFKDNLKESEF